VANRTVKSDDGSDVILDDRLVLRFVLRVFLGRCRCLQAVKHPIDNDPPNDGDRQTSDDEQNFLDEWGHFDVTSKFELVSKTVMPTGDPTLGTRAQHRQRGKVGDCATGRRLAVE
jgi:hypothetical protein